MIAITLVFFIFILIFIAVLALGFYPKSDQDERVVKRGDAALLDKQKAFKVLSYNVQFMAGKDYVFWFDVPDANGPDNRPSAEAMRKTTADVAKIIIDEDPDFVFLQEVDDGAKRTNKQDQLDSLLKLLPDKYLYHTSAFYWKSGFVPHPRILGRTGMKLSTLSKYPLSSSKRHQLALTPDNIIAKHLGIKRAVLETHVPYKEGGELILLNTHLEAFSKQSDTLQRQIAQIDSLLQGFYEKNIPWLIGGDFNLLAPNQYETLQSSHHLYYRPQSEICYLTNKFPCVPSLEDISNNPEAWFSFFSNDPDIPKPDRTLDYLFYSPLLTCRLSSIRQHDTITISDHFPVIATFSLNAYTH